MPRYQRNFLTAVICRVDFERLPVLGAAERPPLSLAIGELFPALTTKPNTELAVSVGPSGTHVSQKTPSTIYEHRRAGEEFPFVALSSEHIALEYRKGYQDYLSFRSEIAHVMRALLEQHPTLIANRVGLRYINQIVFPTGAPLDWNGLINPELVASVSAGLPGGMKLARSLHQMQSFNDEVTLTSTYGASNPDYPGELVRRHFVLDFDASRTRVACSDLIEAIGRLNAACEDAFERSICDELRNIMGRIDD
ncbi:TIGR04255 family protein [Piscinibacter koreensis]|uniref:TIGR04255 family protein n=1 Tax=Piscinibacter koreensis TaxID=2742824 RepID=A0A7Y6NLP4_9BURK|nr:TIGR04255 family protein [Schlegelella koreensis]NUZ05503.1 TIGR04255 family protein [Schlegelella koreensis]